MSGLRDHLADYLALRRGLGYTLERPGRLLAGFVSYLEEAGAVTVTTGQALAWATAPADADPSWWRARLAAVRPFARYLAPLVPGTQIPPRGLLPGPVSRRAVPYLYSPAEVTALIAAAGAIRTPLRAATYQALIGLLAATGMRVGEAIGLDRGDLDAGQGLLTIRDSKFGKSRQLPLHASVVQALASVSDFLCAELFAVRNRMFIRCPSFALSAAVMPGLRMALAESDLPMLLRADAACPGFSGVLCYPGHLLPDPVRIAWRPFPSVIKYSRR